MLQMIEKAENPAELRQLLAEQGLADGIVAAFNNKQLQDLLDKGLVTPAMLAVADWPRWKGHLPFLPSWPKRWWTSSTQLPSQVGGQEPCKLGMLVQSDQWLA